MHDTVRSINELKRALLEALPTTELSIKGSFSRAINHVYAPHNGVVNRERNPNLPLYYPAFTGTIRFCANPAEVDANDFIAHKVYLETGGPVGKHSNGTYTFNHFLTIFLDDWPALADQVNALRLVDALSEDYTNINKTLNEMFP